MFKDGQETLCNAHMDCIDSLTQLKRKHPELKDEITPVIQKIRVCKKKGQRMENRLSKYKSAIESLGFIRNTK